MYFTSECPSEHEKEVIKREEIYATQINALKDEVIKTERVVHDKEREIFDREKTIITLQYDCDRLNVHLQSAKNQQVQDESLIRKLEEDKNALKSKLTRNKEALEDDKTKLKESLESILRSEAELRKNMETNEAVLQSKLQTEAELRKRLETNEANLKKTLKQMIERNMNLKEQFEQVKRDKEKEIEHVRTQQQEIIASFKHQHNEEVATMASKIEHLQAIVVEKENECQEWKSKFEFIEQGYEENQSFCGIYFPHFYYFILTS